MSKTKKRMLTAIFIGFCSLICVFFVSSCSISSPKNSNKDSGHTTQSEYEDEYADFIGREIQLFNVPATATCGYGSYFIPKKYYSYDTYGMRQIVNVSVYNKNYKQVELDGNGGFNVEQDIGTNYYFLYRAIVDNDVVTKKQVVKVMEDSEAPVLTVLQNNIVILEQEEINLSSYVLVEDDSLVEPQMEYHVFKNGEEQPIDGGSFSADAGEYVVRMRGKDGSGHESNWGELNILVRDLNIIADFEIESDIYNGGNYGMEATGYSRAERSDEIVYSGNYSLKWQKTRGTDSDGRFPTGIQFVHGMHGETNGANLGESYLYFGFRIYFLPKDNSGHINIKYSSTKYREGYHWENALNHMWFFVDGDLLGDGKCNGSKTVSLPTEKWVYVVGELVEYANPIFSMFASGYSDDTFTAYIDDMRTAHMVEVASTNVEYDYYYEADAVYNIDSELDPYIKENSSAANFHKPIYEIYKYNSDESVSAVSVSDGNIEVSPGYYVIFYVGADGERAGHYTKLTVRRSLKNLVEYSTDGNDIGAMPYGVVGLNYKIPEALIRDDETTYEVHVFKNGAEIDASNGGFVPTEKGEYKLRYIFSHDDERETFEYSINVEETFLQGELTSDFSSVSKATEGIVGERISLPEVKATGGSGKITQWIELKLNDETVELEISAGSFVPQKSGTYTVTYWSKDYFKVLEESYTVTISQSDTPVFENLPKLPNAFVSGYTYTMKSPDVYSYTQAGRVVKTPIGYWEYNGKRNRFDGSFTPVVENSGDIIKLLYVVDGYEKDIGEFPVKIPEFNGYFDPSAFFLAENGMQASADSAATVLTGATGAKATFINPLSDEPWSFSFGVDSAKNNGTFTILLSDFRNCSSFVALKFMKKNDTTASLFINNGSAKDVSGSFSADVRFSLSFSKGTTELRDEGSGNVLTTFTNIKGWGSEGVQMQIVFEDVVGEFALKCYILNKQPLRLIDEDGVAPDLIKNSNIALVQYINEEIVLPSYRSFDVFDYNVLPIVSLNKVGGAYVTSSDGIKLNAVDAMREYHLTISDEGTYMLVYKATDNNDNTYVLRFTLQVQARGKTSNIKIDGDSARTAKLNEVFNIPTAFGYDNDGNEIAIITYIRYPSSRIVKWNGASITFTEKGTYEIIFYTKDRSGRADFKSVIVTVKE